MKSGIFKGLLGVLFICFIVVSCKKDNAEDKPLDAEDIVDLAYGDHEQQTLDVYLPADRGDTTKVVILLHGGYWAEGDKSDLAELATYLRDTANLAVINMNYRLTGTPDSSIHPAQENDITSAINFISSKAFKWHIPSNKFGLLGASAGGHLALLYTYAYNTSNKVKTVISLSGPTNLDTRGGSLQQAAAVEALLGVSYQDNPALYVKASPLSRASSLSKPTLLFHGMADSVVPYSQSVELVNKLALFGVKADVQLYSTGHELFDDTNKKQILDTIELWLNENIN